MAKRLTEEMVIARTKISDLSKIKRLNCWGSELVDVSLLRRMPSVEVLSLSINKINSLADFEYCRALQELYIRQNDIRDLNQVCYLQNLVNLKNLWLGENPCANIDGYRLAVLRALPQLQKLDNVQVTQEELKDAQRKGRPLVHPEDQQESEEEEYAPVGTRYQEYPSETVEYSPQRSPSRQETTEYENDEAEEYGSGDNRLDEPEQFSPPRRQISPPRRQEPVRRSYSPEPEYDRRTANYQERESPKQYYDRSPTCTSNSAEDYVSTESCRENCRIVTSQSSNSVKEYTNGDRYIQQQQVYRQTEVSEGSVPGQVDRRERHSCPASAHRAPFARRPVTRNSNILSAVLCLVKELDYPSLEVVEMAVRCRMDELDE